MLSKLEEALLVELHRNPAFTGICKKLKERVPRPRYRPDDKDENKKLNEFIYRSGYGDGIDFVLKVLQYDE